MQEAARDFLPFGFDRHGDAQVMGTGRQPARRMVTDVDMHYLRSVPPRRPQPPSGT